MEKAKSTSLSRRTCTYSAHNITSLILAIALVATVACGSATRAAVEAALERGDYAEALSAYNRGKERDVSLLVRVAEVILERESLSGTAALRDAALAGLRFGGMGSRPILERLSYVKNPAIVRARALRILMDFGDPEARSRLRTLLGIDQQEVAAEALSALEPNRDLKEILHALVAIYSEQRLQAARLLAEAAPDSTAGSALMEAARLDPSVEVRARALQSLAAFGDIGIEAIEAALVDQEPKIRLAAVSALVRANRSRAVQVLDKYLNTDPSDVGIESARWLTATDGKDNRTTALARALIFNALSSSDPVLRARAAVALQTLPPVAEEASRLIELLKQEHLPSVRFWIALTALPYRSANQPVRAALRELVKAGGVFGAQAAAQLAKQGDSSALNELLGPRSPSSAVRGVVARLIAIDLKQPLDAYRYLADPDAEVRIAAAGAILAATHR